jgi:uncharacterized peroxidase-related enzyme
MSEPYITDLAFLSIQDASPEAAELLERTRKNLGSVPTMYAAMANSPGLLATYLDGYRRFRSGSGFTPAEQEVVFLTISRVNSCEYCMAAHSHIGAHFSKTPSQVINAIRDDEPIPDPKLSALAAFTRSLLDTAGRPSVAEVEAFRSAGYSEPQMLEVVLAIAVKTLSNWTNHLFATPVDDTFAASTWVDPQDR